MGRTRTYDPGDWGAARAQADAARERDKRVLALVRAMREEGRSLDDIAQALTAQGHRTAWGTRWRREQVRRVLKRAGEA